MIDDGDGLGLVIENASQELADVIQADIKRREEGAVIMRIFLAVRDVLDPRSHSKTRVVFTGDLVKSVNDREQRDKPFTMERGSGLVAAKTMPPNDEGVVDILIPSFWLMPDDDASKEADTARMVGHVAAHESIHAALHHLGTMPFDVYKERQEFGYASVQFVAMASEQIEEHLAEYLSNQVVRSKDGTTANEVVAAFEAFQRTIEVELPAIPEDDPDYFNKGMMVTFEALHILWKALVYLAAEVRVGNDFESVPAEIDVLKIWSKSVAPWWREYTSLLGRIPMSIEIDITSTDAVVVEMGRFLQRWAYDLGFDFHDKGDGGYFRIMIWD